MPRPIHGHKSEVQEPEEGDIDMSESEALSEDDDFQNEGEDGFAEDDDYQPKDKDNSDEENILDDYIPDDVEVENIDFTVTDKDIADIDEFEYQISAETPVASKGQPPAGKTLRKRIKQHTNNNPKDFFNSEEETLYSSNRFPPEYYQAGLVEIYEMEYILKDYAKRTENQISAIESGFSMHV
ncbi:hypothetical protein SCAR479_08508 [Seiridium cardinale]|uniref:Uncharacterized protein n=1 Tax=Seiridium cardinale TaxID=138064 RepID=A0ABR2XMA1_9PEZI